MVSINLGHSSDLFNRHIEPEQVEGFASHSRQVGHPHSFLLDKSQVPVNPNLPLWLWSQLVQARYLFACSRGRVGLLFRGRGNKKENNCKIVENSTDALQTLKLQIAQVLYLGFGLWFGCYAAIYFVICLIVHLWTGGHACRMKRTGINMGVLVFTNKKQK